MIKIFNNLDEKQRRDNLNMIVFNYVVYNNYKQKVNTGEPLHSVYKKFENNRKDVYFIHK